MPAIQVVLLDLGGTLLHYEQPPQYSFEALNALAFARISARGSLGRYKGA